MRVENIYYRGTLINKNDLELIFLLEQKEYVLIFYRSDFFLVSMGVTFSISDFEKWDFKKLSVEGDSFVIKEVKQTKHYDEFYIFFTNGYIMRINHFPDNSLGELIQGIQTFSGLDELQKKTAVDLASLIQMEIIDFRYSPDKGKLF